MAKDPRATFFEIDSSRLERCLSPGLSCDGQSIRAHSIQNAQSLDLLVANGHVVQLVRRIGREGPELDFGLVGRRKASTFTGLCAAHDREIFRDVDTRPVDVNDPWHLFLLAYRAVLRETHATMEAAAKAQAAYNAMAAAGRVPRDQPSTPGMYAVERMMLAYETHQLKAGLDAAYDAHDPTVFQHDVLEFRVLQPSVAASSFFSLDGLVKNQETVRACLTILPLSTSRTVAILSYQQDEVELARLRLARILRASGAHQMYEVSRALLNACDNFVLCPEFFGQWSTAKRDAIRSFFVRTLFEDDLSYEDLNLMLFDPGT